MHWRTPTGVVDDRAMACTGGVSSITPCGMTKHMVPNSTASQVHTVTNGGAFLPLQFTPTCARPALVTSCTVPSTVVVPVHGSTQFTVTYTVGSATGTGTLSINLTGGATISATIAITVPEYEVSVTPKGYAYATVYPAARDTGYITVNVPVPPEPTPVVTPHGALPVDALPHSTSMRAFTVTNAGTGTGLYTLTPSCPAAGWSCSTTLSSVQLDSGQSVVDTASYTTGAAGIDGVIALTASTGGAAPLADSGWASVNVPIAVAVSPDGLLHRSKEK